MTPPDTDVSLERKRRQLQVSLEEVRALLQSLGLPRGRTWLWPALAAGVGLAAALALRKRFRR